MLRCLLSVVTLFFFCGGTSASASLLLQRNTMKSYVATEAGSHLVTLAEVQNVRCNNVRRVLIQVQDGGANIDRGFSSEGKTYILVRLLGPMTIRGCNDRVGQLKTVSGDIRLDLDKGDRILVPAELQVFVKDLEE